MVVIIVRNQGWKILMNLRSSYLIVLVMMASNAWSYGVGQSTHPMRVAQKFLATEFTGIMADGTGFGVQARYTQKINEKIRLDGGLGIGGGERSSRLFVGADYEMFSRLCKATKNFNEAWI